MSRIDPGGSSDDGLLHPADREWRERRFAGAPLIFGVLSFVTAPLVIGLLLGAAGLRSGIDHWRSGIRRPIVVLGIAANAIGIATGIASSLLWGALLANMLLGRDAIRESERWRGRALDLTAIVASDGAPLHAVGARSALVFADPNEGVCLDALRAVAEASRAVPECRIVLVVRSESETGPSTDATIAFAWPLFTASGPLPAPLGDVAVLPTITVIGPDGRIEKALVGAHPAADVEKLLRGDAALDPVPARSAGGIPHGAR